MMKVVLKVFGVCCWLDVMVSRLLIINIEIVDVMFEVIVVMLYVIGFLCGGVRRSCGWI